MSSQQTPHNGFVDRSRIFTLFNKIGQPINNKRFTLNDIIFFGMLPVALWSYIQSEKDKKVLNSIIPILKSSPSPIFFQLYGRTLKVSEFDDFQKIVLSFEVNLQAKALYRIYEPYNAARRMLILSWAEVSQDHFYGFAVADNLFRISLDSALEIFMKSSGARFGPRLSKLADFIGTSDVAARFFETRIPLPIGELVCQVKCLNGPRNEYSHWKENIAKRYTHSSVDFRPFEIITALIHFVYLHQTEIAEFVS